MTALLTNCTTIGQGDMCSLTSPIWIDKEADYLTEQTARQILAHNKKWRCECQGIGCPK